MKTILSFIALLFSAFCLNAQVTPDIEKDLNTQVEKLAARFKTALLKEKEQTGDDDFWINFKVDTLKVERYIDLRMEKDFSTQGMNQTMYEGEKRYDVLLNRYYKILMEKLKGEDKKVLQEAQKAWLAFREKELKLVYTLLSEKYTGGGTMYSNIRAGKIFEITRDRVIELARHCVINR